MPSHKPAQPPVKQEFTQVTQDVRKRIQTSQKADLIFPVARVLRQMKSNRLADKISMNSGVYLTTILEYLTAEILELAGENAIADEKRKKRIMIKPRHITLAFNGDEELKKLIARHVIIPTGGVMPYIHPSLDAKAKKKLPTTQKTEEAEEASQEE
jgi:histone H2A